MLLHDLESSFLRPSRIGTCRPRNHRCTSSGLRRPARSAFHCRAPVLAFYGLAAPRTEGRRRASAVRPTCSNGDVTFLDDDEALTALLRRAGFVAADEKSPSCSLTRPATTCTSVLWSRVVSPGSRWPGSPGACRSAACRSASTRASTCPVGRASLSPAASHGPSAGDRYRDRALHLVRGPPKLPDLGASIGPRDCLRS